jgi:hypothetical protein
MTFYIAVETQAQIEKYSFTTPSNLGKASLTLPVKEIFLFRPSLPSPAGGRRVGREAQITIDIST